jgi:hypothetical protein
MDTLKLIFDVCIVVSLCGLGLVAIRYIVPPTPLLSIEDRHLVITVRGGDMLWPLRRRVRVLLDDLVTIGVRPLDRLESDTGALDSPYEPGDARTGVYGPRNAPELWLVRNAHEVVYVETREPAKYRRIVLQVSDPRAAIAALRSRAAARS